MSRVTHPDADWYPHEAPTLDVVVTDNPIVARLYGPDGEVLIEHRERPPIGFR